MDVRGVGAGPAGVELASLLRGVLWAKGQIPGQTGDSITEILRLLSEPQSAKLLEIIQRPTRPEDVARLEGLLRESVSAALEGRVQHQGAPLNLPLFVVVR